MARSETQNRELFIAMARAGLPTRRAAAQRCDVSYQTFRNALHGYVPSKETQAKIAAALGVPPGDLWKGAA